MRRPAYPMRAVRATKESREQLLQREFRCSEHTRRQVADALRRMNAEAYERGDLEARGLSLTTDEVMTWLQGQDQTFKRGGGPTPQANWPVQIRGMSGRGVNNLTSADKRWDARTVQEVFAQRNKDGTISWSACLWADDGQEGAPCDPTRARNLNRRGRPTFQHKIDKCPCTEEDRVAIDALLEVGDARAEKLAKACAKGGGVLEGSLKKRRRRK